ncbi:MAG: bacillithiol biosynthesis cysteine-adding enzyme BshC [Bacteroidetes bacterium]|nr:bacillithiol biosynthesis cysteine-adding enzyme BshC [Bacteroidota bacterium]
MKTATRNLKNDYLTGATSLRDFYQYPIQTPDFQSIIKNKSRESIDRKLLQEVIREQYQGLPDYDLVNKNIELLGQENTFTVTTGHQLVLFGGPLFTTYKVLSTIKLARELSEQFSSYNIVPIFWIHTEDHDYEEINHFYTSFFDKKTYPGNFQSKVGDHILEDAIQGMVPEHLPENLKNAFRPGIPLAQAYREFMHHLFGPYGVVMLDADDPRLKKKFENVIKEEIHDSIAYKQVSKISQDLDQAGYKLQIAPREINLFFLDQAGRNRIISSNGGFSAVDRDLNWTTKEMDDMIVNNPGHFSPNVSLRPLYQESILPNLCYFGGWGELSYWLQLKGIFDHFGVNFPLLLPRMSATIYTRKQWNKWQELGFSPEDINHSVHEVFRKYVHRIWDDGPYQALKSNITASIEALREYTENEIAQTLSRSVDAQKTKMNNFFGNFEKKIHRVIRADNPKIFREIEELKNELQPDRMVQERQLSLGAFPDFSPESIIAEAWKHCSPLDFSHRYIILD